MKENKPLNLNNLIILFYLLIFIPFTSLSQSVNNEQRLKEIPSEINKAVNAGDYQKAADLKREKELREQIIIALKESDYEKAASLNKQIINGNNSNSNSKITRLENEMKQAVQQEDYQKAGDLKRQIEALKSGNSTTTNSSSTPSYSTTSTTSASTNSNITIPDFNNQVQLINPDGTLSNLDRTEGEFKTSGGGYMVYSYTTSYILKGPKSPLRIRDNGNLRFIIKIAPGLDPSEYVKFYKMEVRGKRSQNRYADISKTNAAPFHADTENVKDKQMVGGIQFKPINSSQGVYEISVGRLQTGGEYAFIVLNKLFSFGID
ncbi:MAG: UvrB/UvrC motif-containing protein [Brumimicrobium sp.]|nr:UvrB/UvrC motif-containing protein [Brumimicrobium sp.]